MQFRTELNLPQSTEKIKLGHSFLTVGSCFAEVIGRRLAEHKLDTLNNPFGTIFNPVSQFELVQAALAPEEQEELPLVQQNGFWYAYNFHSSFTAPEKKELQQQIDFALTLVREQIEKADTLIFTFGTALVYQLAESDRIVANCHKMPQSNFSKRLLQSEEIVAGFTEMFAHIKSVNPKVRVVLSVSPVRHVKDTLSLNSVSKSVLRVACHYLAEMLPDVEYFPAFELLMDDLRDYRFYKDDLLHPTEMAEQYVWQKFAGAYFDDRLQKFAEEWSRIRQSLTHKPFQQDSEGHQQFLQRLLEQLQQLGKAVNVKDEIAQVKQQLMPVRRNKAPKKAPRELVNLLETLAASEVMAEDEDGYRSQSSRPAPEREVTLAEAFIWPDEDEETQPETGPVEQPAPEQTLATDQEAATRQTPEGDAPETETNPAEHADEPRAVVPFVHTKKSKSKKRREKRRAKLLASRAQTVSAEQVAENAPEAAAAEPTVSAPEVAPENEPEKKPAGRPVKKARTARAKSVVSPAAGQPDNVAAATAPVAETPAAPVTPPQSPAPEPAGPEMPPEKPARKKPGRKPAAAVGALLNALAHAQTSELEAKPAAKAAAKAGAKPAAKPARAPRKPAAAKKAKPEVTAAEIPAPEVAAAAPEPLTETNAAPVAPKSKPKRAAVRKPKSAAAPELPFTAANPPESAHAPVPAPAAPAEAPQPQPEPEQAAAKPLKEPKPRKEPAAPRKGKAKKIVLKKAPSGKGGTS